MAHGMKRSEKTGLSPGTPIYIGRKAERTNITMMDYDDSLLREKRITDVKECIPFKDKPTVTWIDVDGLFDTAQLEELGRVFNLHPLILEDILNTHQRPKMEDQGDYIYIVLRMIRHKEGADSNNARKDINLESEQVSIILGPNFVISFQEGKGDVFDPVRERIRNGKGRIRKMGSDYLAYALIDAVVDNYFSVLEELGERIESLEGELVKSPSQRTLHTLHRMKRQMIELRRFVWPLREVIGSLERVESGRVSLIRPNTRIFLRDVYDHTVQVIDTVETYRDMLSGMLDIYLSSVSNRLNEVMKVLTVVGTIFMPLTFIVGVYGMNFKIMPGLGSEHGFAAIMALNLAIALSMLFYFRSRKWI